jgi:hypothetical protein
VGRDPPGRAGAADPQHVRLRDRRLVQGAVRAGRGHRPERPQHQPRRGGPARDGPRRRARPVPQRDRPLRARVPAWGLVPREGRHVHQRRAPDQPGAPGHAEPGRQGRVAGRLRDRDGDGLPDVVRRPVAHHGRDRRDDPDVRRGLVRAPRRRGLDAVAGHDAAPHGTPTMHVGSFVRGLGQLTETVYVPTTERANRRFPLVLTTGRILSQYNVGAQTRRTPNSRGTPRTSSRSIPPTPSCAASSRATSSSSRRGSARRA